MQQSTKLNFVFINKNKFTQTIRYDIMSIIEGDVMLKEAATNTKVKVSESYELIKSLKKSLPQIQDVISNPDIKTIKLIANIQQLLQCNSQDEIDWFFRTQADPTLKKEIAYTQSYKPAFSFDKLKELVERIAKAKSKQSKYSQQTLINNNLKLENLILQQDKEKQELEKKIKELLTLQERILQTAAEKTRFTASSSKKKFEVLQAATKYLVTSKDSGTNIDVKRLNEILWGQAKHY